MEIFEEVYNPKSNNVLGYRTSPLVAQWYRDNLEPLLDLECLQISDIASCDNYNYCKLTAKEKDGVFGMTDPFARIIYIKRGMPYYEHSYTCLYEMIHLKLDLCGFPNGSHLPEDKLRNYVVNAIREPYVDKIAAKVGWEIEEGMKKRALISLKRIEYDKIIDTVLCDSMNTLLYIHGRRRFPNKESLYLKDIFRDTFPNIFEFAEPIIKELNEYTDDFEDQKSAMNFLKEKMDKIWH